MFGCAFMDLSGTGSLHRSYGLFQLSPYEREKKGDQPLVSSLQKALNYVLMLARAASQNTDGLVFEQTNAVTFPCACRIL